MARPKDPANPVQTTERTLITRNGISITVRDRPPPPPRAEPDAWGRKPRAIVLPPNQPAAERAAFLAEINEKWGHLIRNRYERGGVPPKSTEDLQQHLLLILGEHYDENEHEAPDNVPAFLDKVIDNQIRNYRRLRRLALELGRDLDAEIASTPDPERAAMMSELREKLRRYLEELTPEELEVFEARELEELSFEAIGDVVGRPCNTVKHQYDRAIRKLRELARASERATLFGGRLG